MELVRQFPFAQSHTGNQQVAKSKLRNGLRPNELLLQDRFGSDKGSDKHHYARPYELLFQPRREREFTLVDDGTKAMPSPDFQWAAAVAEYGLVLRDSAFKGTAKRTQQQLEMEIENMGGHL